MTRRSGFSHQSRRHIARAETETMATKEEFDAAAEAIKAVTEVRSPASRSPPSLVRDDDDDDDDDDASPSLSSSSARRSTD